MNIMVSFSGLDSLVEYVGHHIMADNDLLDHPIEILPKRYVVTKTRELLSRTFAAVARDVPLSEVAVNGNEDILFGYIDEYFSKQVKSTLRSLGDVNIMALEINFGGSMLELVVEENYSHGIKRSVYGR